MYRMLSTLMMKGLLLWNKRMLVQRTRKVASSETSVAIDQDSGTPTLQLILSPRLVAITSSSFVRCRYRYDLRNDQGLRLKQGLGSQAKMASWDGIAFGSG